LPSSKCQHISLILGDLVNDVKVCLNVKAVNQDLLKQFSETAKRLDELVEMAMKEAYDQGVKFGTYQGFNQAVAQIEEKTKKAKTVKDVLADREDIEGPA